MTFEDVMRGNIIVMKDLGEDCWQLTETIMGQTVSIKIPMNTEVEHPLSGYEQKMIWTRYMCMTLDPFPGFKYDGSIY